ncbi:MAG: hypothetical protein ACR2O1_14435, partial [Boseongicola sp.]
LPMIRFVVVFVALLSATSPALALSCARPNAVHLYQMARDAEEQYYIVRGRIDLTGPVSEPSPGNDTPARTKARISGTALNNHSFGTSFDQEITIEAHCLASWCGSAEGLTGEVFAALQIKNDELTLRVGPCGGDIAQWDRIGEQQILECHRSGLCAATR